MEDWKASFESQYYFQGARSNTHPLLCTERRQSFSCTFTNYIQVVNFQCWEPIKIYIYLYCTGLGVFAIFLFKWFLLNPFSHMETTRSILNWEGYKNIESREGISQQRMWQSWGKVEHLHSEWLGNTKCPGLVIQAVWSQKAAAVKNHKVYIK